MLFRVSFKSLKTRKLALMLIIVALALSISTLLITQSVSKQLKASFNSSVSGTDLIIGARATPLQVVLYSVFRLGTPTQAISLERANEIANMKHVAWSFPIVLGDSHKGYAVLGTNNDYFKYFKYGKQQSLQAEEGELLFKHPLQVVIGSDIAKKLHYHVGDFIMLSHGVHQHSFQHHVDVYFQISAILKPTGTPVDNTLNVHINSLEAIHSPIIKRLVTQDKTSVSKDHNTHKHHAHMAKDHAYSLPNIEFAHLPDVQKISALFIGLNNRATLFQTQALVNAPHAEPLTAVIPGVGLSELWRLLGNAETFMHVMSSIMLVGALLGAIAMLQLSLTIRQQEFGLLRLIGARPWHLAFLTQFDMLIIVICSWLAAIPVSYATMFIIQIFMENHAGILINPALSSSNIGWYFIFSILLALIAGLIPAWASYKMAIKPQML